MPVSSSGGCRCRSGERARSPVAPAVVEPPGAAERGLARDPGRVPVAGHHHLRAVRGRAQRGGGEGDRAGDAVVLRRERRVRLRGRRGRRLPVHRRFSIEAEADEASVEPPDLDVVRAAVRGRVRRERLEGRGLPVVVVGGLAADPHALRVVWVADVPTRGTAGQDERAPAVGGRDVVPDHLHDHAARDARGAAGAVDAAGAAGRRVHALDATEACEEAPGGFAGVANLAGGGPRSVPLGDGRGAHHAAAVQRVVELRRRCLVAGRHGGAGGVVPATVVGTVPVAAPRRLGGDGDRRRIGHGGRRRLRLLGAKGLELALGVLGTAPLGVALTLGREASGFGEVPGCFGIGRRCGDLVARLGDGDLCVGERRGDGRVTCDRRTDLRVRCRDVVPDADREQWGVLPAGDRAEERVSDARGDAGLLQVRAALQVALGSLADAEVYAGPHEEIGEVVALALAERRGLVADALREVVARGDRPPHEAAVDAGAPTSEQQCDHSGERKQRAPAEALGPLLLLFHSAPVLSDSRVRVGLSPALHFLDMKTNHQVALAECLI